ncbi:MAG: aminoacyl-tRNA hydrolase [Nitrospirae bacterium]|nr:aminoacyl-tRNA hydrolase [Nitrospirota bacterium]
MIFVTDTISINEDEIELHFIRSSGPGGQHVNKVSSAVQLRFDAVHSLSLPAEVRQRLVKIAGNRVTKDGVLVIEARQFRTQEQNRQDAVNRLSELIRKASHRPKPRRKTAPTKGSKERRLEVKRRRSATKRLRAPGNTGETT